MEADHLGRDLNQFLPSNVLNDIDINAEENENNQFDEEEEVVDVMIYTHSYPIGLSLSFEAWN